MTISTNTPATNRRYGAISAALFLCLFAGQAGAITLSPVLVEVARDLDVSTAAAGQLRTIVGLVAGVTALALGRLGGRLTLGRQLLGGSALLALGSLASAAAPGIGLLAAAQVPVGAGIAILTTAGTLAAAEWVPSERRAATLSWALIGQPAAWIVGMPLLGAACGQNWRHAWLVFPLVAALIAGAAVAGRGTPRERTPPTRMRAVLEAPGVTRWLASELVTNTAWAGVLVYAGALLVESYQVSTAVTGALLALGAGAHVSGNLAFRRLADREPRRLLVRLSVVLAVTTALFGTCRLSLAASTVFFAAAAFAAGGRAFLASAFGLAAGSEVRAGAMAMRAATVQFGYFTGSFAAGAALALGGYVALGATIGALFLSAALVLRDPPEQGADTAARSARERPRLQLPRVYRARA